MAIRSLDRGLLLAGIAAPIALGIASLVAGSLQGNYSHLDQFISELGASGAPYRAVMNYAGIVPAGVLTVLFSIGMYRRLTGHFAFNLSSLFVTVIGIGRLAAGLFSCDPGCSVVGMSIAAQLHAGFGLLSFCCGAFAPLVLAFGLRVRGRGRLFWLSLGVGLLSVVLLVVLLRRGPGMSYVGAVQRLLLVLTYGWVVTVAIELGILKR